jgi:lysophospholipase L1-like esterase
MAASTVGNQREGRTITTSFLGPLFQDDNWSQQRRRAIFSPSLFLGSTSGFSFLEGSNIDDDEDLLNYLPSQGDSLAPRTTELLKRVTLQYVNGRGPVVEAEEVLDVVNAEYKSCDVPLNVGNVTFDFSLSGDVDDADVAQILSFAAYHRLPADVTLLLIGPNDAEDNSFARCGEAFAREGWKSVRFPRGLSVRPKRKFVKSTKERLMPIPRAWRKDAQRMAQLAVNEATYTKAPPRQLLSREEFLATMDKELSATEPLELLPSLFREVRLIFPRQNKRLKRLRKAVKKQTLLLKHAGLAGLISYVALNFAWYTCAIVFHWHRTSSTVELSTRALGTSLRRFGKVLAAVYVGSQLTRLLRLKLSLVLAPFGNRVLRFIEKKLQVSENVAFALLAGGMIGTCLGIWSIIVLGDAAMLRTGSVYTVQMPM